MKRKLALIGLMTVVLATPALAHTTNPLVGTWKLNLAKSTSTGQLLKSLAMTFTGEGQNLINTTEGIDAQGRALKNVLMHIYDGKPHSTMGNPTQRRATLITTRLPTPVSAPTP
jgi:hypothetical protein